MKQLRQLILGGLAILAISASPGLNAATSDCFVPARDGSGIGDLHLLSSDPLEVGALTELKVSRASAFFRDTDLAGITADMVGQLLVAARPNPLELEAARTALQVLRALLASNKMLPEVQVAEISAPDAATPHSG